MPDDRLRVGIDIRTADPADSGQQRYLWRLGGWLANEGHDVHLLTVRSQPGSTRAPEGAELHRLELVQRADLRARVRDLRLDALLVNPERARRYRGIRANVLRAGYGTDHYAQRLRSFRRPAERALHGALRAAPWVAAERRWERAYYEASPPPEVIAQSAYIRGEILETYAVPDDRVHVVHNAVDLDELSIERRAALREEMRARWGVPADALCLLFLGHNFRLKGLWQLLSLMRSLGPDVHLLAVGRGSSGGQRRRARRLVARHGLEGRVTLAGPVRPALHALAAADALLHLSWHDSFGFVALEAMACGLPVVTTPWVGAAELIDDGVSGLIVDPAGDREVVDAVARLGDDAVRARIGAAAAAAAARHGEPHNFRQVERVLRTARERGHGPVR